jgi:hypothetical protein
VDADLWGLTLAEVEVGASELDEFAEVLVDDRHDADARKGFEEGGRGVVGQDLKKARMRILSSARETHSSWLMRPLE